LDDTTLEASLRQGAVAYLAKPFSEEALLAAVQAAMTDL